MGDELAPLLFIVFELPQDQDQEQRAKIGSPEGRCSETRNAQTKRRPRERHGAVEPKVSKGSLRLGPARASPCPAGEPRQRESARQRVSSPASSLAATLLRRPVHATPAAPSRPSFHAARGAIIATDVSCAACDPRSPRSPAETQLEKAWAQFRLCRLAKFKQRS